MRAKQELHELWMNPLARRNRRQDLRTAAKFSGLSSNQIVLAETAGLQSPMAASQIVAPEEVCITMPDTPSYEGFRMRSL